MEDSLSDLFKEEYKQKHKKIDIVTSNTLTDFFKNGEKMKLNIGSTDEIKKLIEEIDNVLKYLEPIVKSFHCE